MTASLVDRRGWSCTHDAVLMRVIAPGELSSAGSTHIGPDALLEFFDTRDQRPDVNDDHPGRLIVRYPAHDFMRYQLDSEQRLLGTIPEWLMSSHAVEHFQRMLAAHEHPAWHFPSRPPEYQYTGDDELEGE